MAFHGSVRAMYPTRDIRYKAIDGCIVVLDLRAGEYVILNRVATAMWKALVASADPQERIARLQRHFSVPAARLEADLATFVQECVAKGFLQHQRPTSGEPRPRTMPGAAGGSGRSAMVVRAWLSLLATTRILARQDFGNAYEAHRRLPKPLPGGDDGRSDERIARAERAFVRAENFFPLRRAPDDCLPRSLALYRFLLSIGLPADHCIGVQRFPFEAHAWVECGGRVLLDQPENVATYAVLTRI